MTASSLSLDDYSLFLFDFDGLLVDTERLHLQAYQELCRFYKLHLAWSYEEFCQRAHRSSEYLRERLFAEVKGLAALGKSWDELYTQKKAIYFSLISQQGVPLMPGVAELLRYLHSRNKTCCVVTHSPRKDVEFIRQQHAELRGIPHWITREDYTRSKPAPDGYLEAIARYLPAGGRAIGFEDSPRGIQALQEAGVQPVFVTAMEYEFFPPARREGVHCIASCGQLLWL
jgi:HAD superfamily hydrolase (TIGR01509 family)